MITTRIGKFELVRRLGGGGMAKVARLSIGRRWDARRSIDETVESDADPVEHSRLRGSLRDRSRPAPIAQACPTLPSHPGAPVDPLGDRLRAAGAFFALVAIAGCGKAATTDLRPTEAPVARRQAAVADAAGSADAPIDAGTADAFGNFGRDNASGVQLGPEIDTGVATRNPARDLSTQIGGDGARAVPSNRIPTRVMLESDRALGPSSLGSAKIAVHYMGTGEIAVKRCYEALLASEPGTAGTLTMRFAVTPAGHVVDATVHSWSATLSKCVHEVMSTWTFPAPTKQARFELVLSLEAE